MLSKGKINIILSLCLISLTSIGFSSWTITQSAVTSANVQGNFDVDNVINSNEYITLTSAPSCFTYGERGFIDVNQNYVKDASITATYNMNIENCKSLFTDINEAYISITLKHTDECVFPTGKGLFDSYNISNVDPLLVGNCSFTSSVSLNGTVITLANNEMAVNNNEYTINFKIGNHYTITDTTPNSIEISLSYHWTIDDSTNYFETDIYPIINNNGSNRLNFLLSASISGN